MTTVTAINTDIELMAHLIRRAGFSATRDELNRYMEQGYESTVEELLNPKDRGLIPEDIIRRLHMSLDEGPEGAAAKWLYQMIFIPKVIDKNGLLINSLVDVSIY